MPIWHYTIKICFRKGKTVFSAFFSTKMRKFATTTNMTIK